MPLTFPIRGTPAWHRAIEQACQMDHVDIQRLWGVMPQVPDPHAGVPHTGPLIPTIPSPPPSVSSRSSGSSSVPSSVASSLASSGVSSTPSGASSYSASSVGSGSVASTSSYSASSVGSSSTGNGCTFCNWVAIIVGGSLTWNQYGYCNPGCSCTSPSSAPAFDGEQAVTNCSPG